MLLNGRQNPPLHKLLCESASEEINQKKVINSDNCHRTRITCANFFSSTIPDGVGGVGLSDFLTTGRMRCQKLWVVVFHPEFIQCGDRAIHGFLNPIIWIRGLCTELVIRYIRFALIGLISAGSSTNTHVDGVINIWIWHLNSDVVIQIEQG